MFSSHRNQPASQQVESESDSDETTIFTAENGKSAKQKGEWHFGVRAYDLNQDLDLPQIRPGPTIEEVKGQPTLFDVLRAGDGAHLTVAGKNEIIEPRKETIQNHFEPGCRPRFARN